MSEIQGPLGLWPFPILNTLIQLADNTEEEDSFSMKEYNVVRDERGNIESVQIVKGINDE